MGNQNIEVELDSLRQAADAMTSGVVEEITSLSKDFVTFLQALKVDAWSAEDACLDFGFAYIAAIETYDQVLQGVKKDVVRYRDSLLDTYDAYRNADDSALGQMNARLAGLDDVMIGDRMGHIAYGQRPVLDDGSDSPAAAPPDTSPGQ